MPTASASNSATLPRWQQLQQSLASHQAVLLSTPSHISYLTQFPFLVAEEREAFLVITATQLYLLHAHFSPIPKHLPAEFLPGTSPQFLKTHLKMIQARHSLTELQVETNQLVVDEYQTLEKIPDLKLSAFSPLPLWQQRAVKDATELKALKAAAKIASQAWERLKPLFKVGATELEIQRQLDGLMAELGSEKPAFPTIVAFGAHGALPHHQPTTTKLRPNTAVLCDFGATVNGYRSDMTRSYWFGSQPTAEYQKIESIVHQAYDATLTALKAPTKTAQTLDEAARNLISQAGYGPQYIHTTGHGVGLDIHEPPSLNWKSTAPIVPNMAITIEPGIYLEGKFGYRYENTVIVTTSGDKYQELTLLKS